MVSINCILYYVQILILFKFFYFLYIFNTDFLYVMFFYYFNAEVIKVFVFTIFARSIFKLVVDYYSLLLNLL